MTDDENPRPEPDAGEAPIDEPDAGEAPIDEPDAGEAPIDEPDAGEAPIAEPIAAEDFSDEPGADEALPDEPGDDGPPPVPPDKGPSKLALVAVGVVALLAGVGTAVVLGNRGSSCPGKDNALEVEGTTVSTVEFGRRVELLRALYDVRPPTEEAKLKAFRGDAAKGMAVAALVADDVAERKLQAADKTVRDGLDRFIAQRYPEGGRGQFIQALGNYGVSEDDVIGEFRRLLETRALFQAVTSDVTVSEDDLTRTFNEKKDQLAVPERRHLRHLVVKTEDEAKQALDRINGPETFETVAKAISLDTSTKDQGGDLGTVSQAQLDPAFGAAAFAVAQGKTFGPVQTKNGWHVGLVEEVTAGHPVTLAEVHDSLRDTMVADARLTKWRAYLADRIKSADACYAEGNRPADPKAAPADVTPGTLSPTPTTPTTTP